MPKSSLRCHIDGIHQTLVSHRASHQSFISLETAVCSSFIFHKSPVKYISIKLLQEEGSCWDTAAWPRWAPQPDHLRWHSAWSWHCCSQPAGCPVQAWLLSTSLTPSGSKAARPQITPPNSAVLGSWESWRLRALLWDCTRGLQGCRSGN